MISNYMCRRTGNNWSWKTKKRFSTWAFGIWRVRVRVRTGGDARALSFPLSLLYQIFLLSWSFDLDDCQKLETSGKCSKHVKISFVCVPCCPVYIFSIVFILFWRYWPFFQLVFPFSLWQGKVTNYWNRLSRKVAVISNGGESDWLGRHSHSFPRRFSSKCQFSRSLQLYGDLLVLYYLPSFPDIFFLFEYFVMDFFFSSLFHFGTHLSIDFWNLLAFSRLYLLSFYSVFSWIWLGWVVFGHFSGFEFVQLRMGLVVLL